MIRLEYPKARLDSFANESEKLFAVKNQLDILTNNLQIVLDSIEEEIESIRLSLESANKSSGGSQPSGGGDDSYTETDPVFTASAASGIRSSDITGWNNKSDFSGSYNDLTNKPTIPTVPANVSAFTNDAGYLTSYTETDPTVPAWAKAASKPTYTASEVGALPDTTQIPSNTSDLTNDSGFITMNQVPTELPSVTSSDNGKVLRVVSGAWSAVQLPSASGVNF